MKKEIKYSLEKWEKALKRLREGVAVVKDVLDEDGVIQRFEFTFETFWKALKMLLNEKGVIARTPKDVLKEAFRLEWLPEEKVYLDMLEDRNRTSHIYDEKTSREIFKAIKERYVKAIEEVLNKVK